MPANVEIEHQEAPQIIEHPDQFPETISASTGVQVVQKNFTAQVNDNQGKPIIQTPPTQVITSVQPPANTQTLLKQSKGSVASSSTWRAAFWLRIIKKAMHFGWQIVGHEPTATSS